MTPERVGRAWLAIRTEPPPTEEAGAGADVWVAHLDGRRCRTDRQFLDAVADALGFPEYYGHNWDAFDECFRDLFDITEGGMGIEWGGSAGRPEHALHLVVHHAEELLVNDDPRYLGVVLETFRSPRHTYFTPQPQRRYADFRATFVCAPDALESFHERLGVAGLRTRDLR